MAEPEAPADARGLVEDEAAVRARIGRSRRIVIKIGSKSLHGDAWARLAAEIAAVRRDEPGLPRRSVVLVSSGAIALGVAKLGLKARPKDMAWLQAAAAAGQSVLMRRYEEEFGKLGITVARQLSADPSGLRRWARQGISTPETLNLHVRIPALT